MPAMASSPLLKSVMTEAMGNPKAIDDAARPASDAAIHMTFALSTFDKQALDAYAAAVVDKQSPLYRKWLKPAQLGEMFGAPQSDIDTVISYLNSKGFTGVKVWPDRMFVSAQGTRSVVEKSFGVNIYGYDRDLYHIAKGYSKTYYAPDRGPVVPATVADRLIGIWGLSNAVQRVPSIVKFAKSNPDVALDGSLLPGDITNVYQTAPLRQKGYEGQGETIAIFSPTTFAESDITAFEVANGITKANINIINVNGGATDDLAEDEADLDIETVIGQAPGATVNVYEGPNDGSFDIFNQMEYDDPNIVSMSYGQAEDEVGFIILNGVYVFDLPTGQAYADSEATIHEAMSAEGITIFVASGDDGAFTDADDLLIPAYALLPWVSVDAASPYVTGVGGTELYPIAQDQWNGEQAWSLNDGTLDGGGSGGGLSIYYTLPSWQVGYNVDQIDSDGMRQVPDVAACASTPYYQIWTGGAQVQVGGTSASTPVWAASMALIEQDLGLRFGCINPELYAIAATNPGVYHDINLNLFTTSATNVAGAAGTNGVYTTNPGWDFVTGWGSANFNSLCTAISTPNYYTFQPGLQMISFPYAYPSTDTMNFILTGLVSPDGAPSTQVAAWEPLYQNYAVTPTAPSAYPLLGQGYWARFSSTGGALTALGTAISQPYYGITLQPGWNMVGNPYLSPVSVDNLEVSDGTGTHSYADAVASGDLSSNFYTYSSTLGYVAVSAGGTLVPYNGYWIYAGKNIQLTFLNP
jgi:subtilase family serine protease